MNPADQIVFSSSQAMISLFAIMGSLIGLAVWLVKQTKKGQDEVNIRYFTHLEKSAAASQEVHKGYVEAIKEIGVAVRNQSEEIAKMTTILSGRPCILHRVESKQEN